MRCRAATGVRGGGLALVAVILASLAGAATVAGTPGNAIQADPAPKPGWFETIRDRIEPLRHSRGERWPLVLWQGPDAGPLSVTELGEIARRGIAPRLDLSVDAIDAARRVRRAGLPVVIVDARGAYFPARNWPYDLAGASSTWAHRYPPSRGVPERWLRTPSPVLFSGWSVAAGIVRDTLAEFRRAGVEVDALWLDWEGEPSAADYEAASASPSTRAVLPAGALDSPASFRRYTRQLWLQLLSAYVAAPAREVFPGISVTNWVATLSLPEAPPLSWDNQPHPPAGPTLLTHSNPVAYGVDTAWFHLVAGGQAPTARTDIDRMYFHLLLRQVSADARARLVMAPEVGAVAWVARRVRDHPSRYSPAMSRSAYREALRHLWLRGLDTMAVFNPGPADGRALAEVEDAVAVYDEMLANRHFLEHGRPLELAIPNPRTAAYCWSGLVLDDRALVRVVSLDGGEHDVELEPWPGHTLRVRARPAGETLVVSRDPAASD